ncbi:hypothetical protein RUE5091_00795 [Ruegeria denitrificans]|uniref:Uncharacterized protein n=1 Tax=Ruegeria denitrificans TaxID=1715692 RepID=A0A0P1I451_9RHOB|nr:hypothetical protein [Ruegeria denitrificans]CUJ88953.1 hypothetical protein RUE5091_00795 [Ruegeria denitrificans]
MAKTLKDLLLAMLNATLILVALCLFLGWKLASTVEDITMVFSEKAQVIAPLRDEIRGVQGELVALRSDLADVQAGGSVTDISEKLRISTALVKLDNLEEGMQITQARIAEITQTPGVLINSAIEKSADVVADRIIAIRGCVPSS